MRTKYIIAVVLGMLVLSGCGDQFWCGENGCSGKKIVSTSAYLVNIQNGPILEYLQ